MALKFSGFLCPPETLLQYPCVRAQTLHWCADQHMIQSANRTEVSRTGGSSACRAAFDATYTRSIGDSIRWEGQTHIPHSHSLYLLESSCVSGGLVQKGKWEKMAEKKKMGCGPKWRKMAQKWRRSWIWGHSSIVSPFSTHFVSPFRAVGHFQVFGHFFSFSHFGPFSIPHRAA